MTSELPPEIEEKKLKPAKPPKTAKPKSESKAALAARFKAGAAARLIGKSATKPWLTARTPLTVKSVITSHGRHFVRLLAKRGDKAVLIHLSPEAVKTVSEKVKK